MDSAAELSALRAEESAFYRQHRINQDYLQKKLVAFNQRHSPLLRLPAEIRNRIYAYAIGGHELCWIDNRIVLTPIDWPVSVKQRLSLFLALSNTSHQLHCEVAPLLFRLNAIRVTHIEDLDKFFAKLSDDQVNMIEVVVVGYFEDDRLDLAPLLRLQHQGSLRQVVLIYGQSRKASKKKTVDKVHLVDVVRRGLKDSGGRAVEVVQIREKFSVKEYLGSEWRWGQD